MRAIYYTKYGSPEVLSLREIPTPVAGEKEILIKIHAASVNPLDWHFMRGTPHVMRLMSGFFQPKVKQLGVDMAGEVLETGTGVVNFRAGDRVFGTLSSGAFAEYAAVPDTTPLVKIPENLSWPEAAAMPVAAVTALQGLRDAGKIKKGQKILIHGASGGVGTFAIQLAKYYGGEVTAVCSSRNLELVSSLGADSVIDYTREDFSDSGKTYDLIFDLVGNHNISAYRKSLVPGGRAVICGFTSMWYLAGHLLLGPLSSMASNRKVGMMPTARPNVTDFSFLADLAGQSRLKSVIDRYYTLDKVPEAIGYVETARARGKVIITIFDGIAK